MNKIAEALYLANVAMAANYFLRAKTAAYNRIAAGADPDTISETGIAANGALIEKSAAFQEFGVTDAEAEAGALYDAAKGIIRLRNMQLM